VGHLFASFAKLVFAHRGGAALAPENTLAAFAHGLALGCDGLECDVHLSRDGIPVVIHDATLDRTTAASGPVALRTAAELARVDAGYWFQDASGRFPFRGQGIGVPALADVLRAFPDVPVIVEMKRGEPALARAVVDVVRRADAVERVCVGSFHRHGIDLVRREAPDIATSACIDEVRATLYRGWCRWPFRARRPYVAFQVPERSGRLRVVSPAFVRQAHRCGTRVDVWVVDTAEDVERLMRWGADGVITDRPDVVVAARDACLRATAAHGAP
jgi:glycerophosphoryl diester phosphodiesterase